MSNYLIYLQTGTEWRTGLGNTTDEETWAYLARACQDSPVSRTLGEAASLFEDGYAYEIPPELVFRTERPYRLLEADLTLARPHQVQEAPVAQIKHNDQVYTIEVSPTIEGKTAQSLLNRSDVVLTCGDVVADQGGFTKGGKHYPALACPLTNLQRGLLA